MPIWAVGPTAVCAAAGLGEMEFLGALMVASPCGNPEPADKFLPLALLCVDIVRSDALAEEVSEQPEGIIVGAINVVSMVVIGNPTVAKAIWQAGLLEVCQATIARFSPMERVGRKLLIPAFMLDCVKCTTEAIKHMDIEIVQPLLDAGVVDSAISMLAAYQMLGNPSEANAVGLLTCLFFLEIVLGSSQPEVIVRKLRGTGVETFRYLLDQPVLVLPDLGFESGVKATIVAALVRIVLLCSSFCSLVQVHRAPLDTHPGAAGLGQRRRRRRPCFSATGH